MDTLTKEQRHEKFLKEHPNYAKRYKLEMYDLSQKQKFYQQRLVDQMEISQKRIVERIKQQKIRTEKYKKFLDLFNEGKTQEQIGIKFNVTRQYVQQVLKKLGIKRRVKYEQKVSTCSGCGNTLIIKGVRTKNERFFCDRQCLHLFMKQRALYLEDLNRNKCSKCGKKFSEDKLIKKRSNIKSSYKRYICRKCNTNIAKKYRHSKEGKLKVKIAAQKAYKKYPLKVKARTIVHRAINSGKIKKPKICSKCKKRKKLDAHHDDYSKPLNIKWLCRGCHADRHRKLKVVNK